jgi:hypothetical protein
MTPEALIAQYPRIWHMAMDGSWPSIQVHGLLSTSALLDLYGYAGHKRLALEARRRPESVAISAEGLPGAIIRDQKPMSDSALKKCLLDGTSPEEWYRLLNSKTFFWLSQARLQRLLGARAYRNAPQVILTLNTASLVKVHAPNIMLCPINSGSTIFNPAKRGLNTFKTIADYPFDEWAKKRQRRDAVVELVVSTSVPDITDHVIAVHRVLEQKATEIWRRPGAAIGAPLLPAP